MNAGSTEPSPESRPRAAGERLDSWKQVAAYLQRDVRTVQRWEKREGLPVHRHLHEKAGSVYAYRDEIDAWWNNRRPRLEAQSRPASFRRPFWLVTVLAAVALSAWLGLRFHRIPGSDSQPELSLRRVWTGADADRFGAPSPDGSLLAYIEPEAGDLALIEVATGQQRRLTRKDAKARSEFAQFPIFSPDGRRLAYSWFNQDLYAELRVIEADGSGQRLLYRNPDVVMVEPHDWSPDGRHILALFHRADRSGWIAQVSLADGSIRVLKELDWRRPDKMCFLAGGLIVYDMPVSSVDHDLLLLPVDSPAGGPAPQPLVRQSGDDLLLGCSPDRETVLFSSNRTGSVDAWSVSVRRGTPAAAPALIKKEIGALWPLGFSRDGSYFYAVQTGIVDVYVASVDVAAGTVIAGPEPATPRFAGAARSPDWSPDGLQLTYVSQHLPGTRPSEGRIFVRALDSEQQREIRPGLSFVETLHWLPGGTELLAAGADQETRQGLFRIDPQTGATTAIVRRPETKAYFHDFACSPDGRHVFYKIRDLHAEPGRLFLRDLATGGEREFLPSVYRFAISPDGRRLAYATFDDQAEFIRVVPSAGGPDRELHRQSRGAGRIYSLAWSRDARHLLFSRRGELWRLAADGGALLNLGLRMESMRELRLHPDGRRLAFTAGAGRAEVWVMDKILPPR